MTKNRNGKVNNFAVTRANNVMALVYVGAAILIVVVGLRGLGTVAGKISFIPKFLLDSTGRIDPDVVIFALMLEFSMLLVLSLVTYFTPSENGDSGEKTSGGKLANVKEDLEEIKNFSDEEIHMIENYIDKFESISRKITKIQMYNMQALKNMKDAIKS